MFPTANSSIYRNADGEVLGWDTHYDDAPDQDDFYEQDYDEPELLDPETCPHANRDMNDRRTGRPALEEMPTEDALFWLCIDCESEIPLTKEELDEYYEG